MTNIEAVVIDVDDTLCMTEDSSFYLENTALERMGRPPMTREMHLETWGQPLFEIITTRSPGIDVEAFKAVFHPAIQEFLADGRLDTIPEENYQALDALVAAGKFVMLLTSRTFGEFKHMLEPDHLLASRVKSFYHKDATRYAKPDPRAFDELLEEHSLLPEQCVYIGDSPSDAAAATGRGLHFIASLESGIRQREDFSVYTVAAYVDKFPDIVGAIAALESSNRNSDRY